MSQVVPHFRTELEALQRLLLDMGALAEDRLRAVLEGLTQRDVDAIGRVLDGDEPLNQLQLEIDNRCFLLLALHQPMARDLRAIVSAIRINGDLERVGDLAVNIAEAAARFIDFLPFDSWFEVPRMGTIARTMLATSLQALQTRDTALARRVLDTDDTLDALRSDVFRAMLDRMRQEPASVEPLLDLLSVSRHLERIGDHATNIAEDVIFIAEALDVRHQGPDAERA